LLIFLPGGSSLIAGVGVLLAPMPFLFYKYGVQIRARSKYACVSVVKPTAASNPHNEESRRPASQCQAGSIAEQEADVTKEMTFGEGGDIEKKQSDDSINPNKSADPYREASVLEKA
jgi:hypothetical protein